MAERSLGLVTLVVAAICAGNPSWAEMAIPADMQQQHEKQKNRWKRHREESDQEFYQRLGAIGDETIQKSQVYPSIDDAGAAYEPPQKVRATLGLWRLLGIHIREVFPGPGGTTGIHAELVPGRGTTFYMDADGGKFTIAGEIRGMPINAQGDSPGGTDVSPGVKGGNRVMISEDALRALPSIRQGNIDNPAGKILFAFIDFRCKHCFRFFDVVQEVLNETAFEVRWIPIAFGGPVSETAAAWALGGDTTPEDLRELFKMSIFEQGRKDLEILMQDKKRIVQGAITMDKTLSAVKRMNIHVTPYLFRLREGYLEAFEGGLEVKMLKLWMDN